MRVQPVAVQRGDRWLKARWRMVVAAAVLLVAGGGEQVEPPVARSEPSPEVSGATAPPKREAAAVPSAAAIPEREAEPVPREPRVPQLDCVPIRAYGYRKGKRFPITVVTIDGRMVERRTADAYMAMHEAAAEAGVDLPLYSGFRTQAEQRYFYRCYKTCSCNACTRAARPGHSNHQSGRALDIGLWEGTHAWLVAHAKEYGFRSTIRSEPWHWEYRGGKRTRWPKACASEG